MGASILPQLDLFADPLRARLLLLLEPQELSVGEIGEVVQAQQPTVSRHLRALADAGWVTSRAEGTSRLYRAVASDRAPAAELWRLVATEVSDSPDARRDAERARHVLARRQGRGDFFAASAGQWDALRTELFGPRVELLPLLGLLEPDSTVGDLGCGTGHLALALAPFVRRVVAVDGSTPMLEMARTRLAGVDNIELRQGDLATLPVRDGELDVALLSVVLCYADDPRAVLREAARGLAPGGRLLLVDLRPHEQEELRQRFGQRWLGFDAAELGGWLDAAGFTRVRIAPLPAEPTARGPLLFAASAWKGHPAPVPHVTRQYPQPDGVER
ncbi:MAG: metalloregulator ArsR/SmtB family transcription factor [Gemmatimonadales bacterium]|jgi:ArsR family transcriptional regulator|nr:metalloregulator ArsR/SmtB family transcription factor [Gemmatimonadales bacterium]